mgnify:CR=1 FL=1
MNIEVYKNICYSLQSKDYKVDDFKEEIVELIVLLKEFKLI